MRCAVAAHRGEVLVGDLEQVGGVLARDDEQVAARRRG